ncbi:MAG TPA: diguanylate cyclase [Thiohalobacter sp.]|nr:diguanylate cyclase [Thiohalobacter sp.]
MPYIDASGRVFRLLGTSFEISRTVHLDQKAHYQSSLLNAYPEESPDGILVVDSHNHIKSWNQRFLEIWNIPARIMEARDAARAPEIVREQLQDPDEFIERINYPYQHLDQEERGRRIRMRDGPILERYSRGLRDREGSYWDGSGFTMMSPYTKKITEEQVRFFPRSNAARRTHRLRRRRDPENSRRGAFGITVSIGVSELQPQDADTEESPGRADKALYSAKEGGRNRVTSA